jgi:type II secretory pathway pseudopilin PulG
MEQHGHTILETVMAMAIVLMLAAVTLALADSGQAGFAAQGEAADIQQRLRVAIGALSKDLLMAGAGADYGADPGPLYYSFAPVLPYLHGTSRDDSPGTFRADAITVLYVPPTVAPSTVVTSVSYFLKNDPETATYQLMVREGAGGDDLSLVDHIVALTFTYYGDPKPPTLTGWPLSDPAGPWTTYGPPPPPADEQLNGYPSGENCTFMIEAVTGVQVPRLDVLEPDSAGDSLIRLTAEQLTDGPWCPDARDPSRWDADLLRIRKIGVTIRIEAADASTRGPAGVLFAHGGPSRNPRRWVPDRTVTFYVSPRNLAR